MSEGKRLLHCFVYIWVCVGARVDFFLAFFPCNHIRAIKINVHTKRRERANSYYLHYLCTKRIILTTATNWLLLYSVFFFYAFIFYAWRLPMGKRRKEEESNRLIIYGKEAARTREEEEKNEHRTNDPSETEICTHLAQSRYSRFAYWNW